MLLDWRKVDKSSFEIVDDQAALDQALKRCLFETREKIDFSTLTDEELTAAVRNYVAADEVYLVWWAHDRCAVRMSGASISTQIAKLWFPASDDVFIYDKAMQPVLHVHHEEQLWIP